MSSLNIRLNPDDRIFLSQAAGVYKFVAPVAFRTNEVTTFGIKFELKHLSRKFQTTMSAFPHGVLLRKAENYHSAACARRQ